MRRYAPAVYSALVFLLTLGFLSCNTIPDPPQEDCCNGKFTIKLFGENQEPIEGAIITLTQGKDVRSKTSTREGVTFNELCEGTYMVRIAKDGYVVQEFPITIKCNQHLDAAKVMQRKDGGEDCCNSTAVIGAKDASTGAILTGATVNLWKGNQKLETLTIGREAAFFDGLCKGEYSVSIVKEGYAPIEFSFKIDGCEQHKEFVKALQKKTINNDDSCCNGRVAIKLIEANSDNRIGGATVKMWRNGAIVKSGTTNADGKVVFEGICAGEYGFSITRDGYTSTEFELEVGCNKSIELTKGLMKSSTNEQCCTAIIKLRIREAETDNEWLSGATMKIYKNGQLLESATSNSEGYAMVDGLCGNSVYLIKVLKDGYEPKQFEWRIGECKTYTEAVGLLPN